MNFKKTILSALATLFLVSPVLAELVFPSLSYRTGAYGPNGIPLALTVSHPPLGSAREGRPRG